MPSPTAPPPVVEEEFDFLAFWIQHKRNITLLLGLLVFGLLAFGVFQYTQHQSRLAAARDLTNAKTADDYRRVIADHAKSVVAGNAALLLAEQLRGENKLDESTAALNDFIAKQPGHPLISGAWVSLAVNLEMQGKVDEALANYQKVAASHPTSFSAPAALLAQGRIFKAKGKIDEARRAYETVISQFGGSLFARLAAQENQQLKK